MFDKPNSYVTFLQHSELVIASHIEDVVECIRKDGLSGGLWHPNGFATFRVRLDDQLGLVRLHVWPKGVRRKILGHPEVHRHSFDLYSRIIAGTYIESQYLAIHGDENSGLKEYTVQAASDEGLDKLAEGQSWISLDVTFEALASHAGGWHDLPQGVYHKTIIPDDALCATLAVLGRHHPEGRNALIGSPGFNVAPRARPPVTETEVGLICSQLRGQLHF